MSTAHTTHPAPTRACRSCRPFLSLCSAYNVSAPLFLPYTHSSHDARRPDIALTLCPPFSVLLSPTGKIVKLEAVRLKNAAAAEARTAELDEADAKPEGSAFF